MASAADVLTFTRIILSPFLLLVNPHSPEFLILFLLCGLTDVLDGWLARKFHTETEFGARLDSFADLLMFIALMFVIVTNVAIPAVVWVMVVLIVVIKIVSFAIGKKHGFFGFRHTTANRMTGVLVFFSVPLFLWFEPMTVGILACGFAFFAALDEMSFNIRDARHACRE